MRVAVVGAGVSGASAAYRVRTLLGPAADIVLIEQSGGIGGKLRTESVGGQPFDLGAEAFLARRPEAVELAGELGLPVVHPSGARSALRAGGHTVRLPTATFMGIPARAEAVGEVLSPGARRAVDAERAQPLDWPGDLSVGELLRPRFGDELVDRLVDPLLGGVYAGGSGSLGVRATLPALAAELDGGAPSVGAAVSALLPDPSAAPDPRPVFGTVPGGLTRLVETLVDAAGARLWLNTTARELHRAGRGWRLRLGAVAAEHAPAEPVLDADAVVLAVPPPAARRLLADQVPAASAELAEIEVASMAVVGIALPPTVTLPEPAGVLIGTRERRSGGGRFTAKAFTFSSRKWTHYDGVLVRGSVGRYGNPGPLRATDDELVRSVLDDLAELTGIRESPIDTAVVRWGGGLPQYGVGHRDRVARLERAVAGQPGLAIAGAALHGVGIPACIATAGSAAQRIADHVRGTAGPAAQGGYR